MTTVYTMAAMTTLHPTERPTMKLGEREFRITCVERHPDDGYWMARVGGIQHDRRFGSWQVVVPGQENQRREALPVVAAALQDKVRRLEKGETLTGDETVSWPTGEDKDHNRRIGRGSFGLTQSKSQRNMLAPQFHDDDPAMGPAEVAMARLEGEDA